MENSSKLEELTECPICSETFQQPKVLPCIHTFCFKCLVTYSLSKESRYVLPCPVCRKEFPLPASGLKELPNNYFIQKLLDIRLISGEKQIPDQQKCDICNSTSEEAMSYCFDCRHSLCDMCIGYHDKMRFNKGHKVISAERNEDPRKIMNMTSSFCERHQEEPVKYYCVDCFLVICVSCYVEEHSTHKCTNISKEAKAARAALKADIQDVSRKTPMLEKLSKELKFYGEDLKRQIENQKDKVTKRQAIVKQFYDTETAQVLEDISEIWKTKTKELIEASDTNQSHILMVDSYTSYASRIQENATDPDLLQCLRSLQIRAEELRYVPTTTEYVPVSVEFREKERRIGVIHQVDQIKGSDYLLPYKIHATTEEAAQRISHIPDCVTAVGDMLCFFSKPQTTPQAQQFGPIQTLLVIAIPATMRGNLPYSHLCLNHILQLTSNVSMSMSINSYRNANSEVRSVEIAVPSEVMKLNTYSETASFIFNYNYMSPNCLILVKINIKIKSQRVYLEVSDIVLDHQQNIIKDPPVSSVAIQMAERTSVTSVTVFDRKLDRVMLTSSVYLRAKDIVDLITATGCSHTDNVYLLDRNNCAIHKLNAAFIQVAQWRIDYTPEHMSSTKSNTLVIACSTEKKILEMDTVNGSLMREICLQSLKAPVNSAETSENLTRVTDIVARGTQNNTTEIQVADPNQIANTMQDADPNVNLCLGNIKQVYQRLNGFYVIGHVQSDGTMEIAVCNSNGCVVHRNIAVGLNPVDIQLDRNGCVLVLASDGNIYIYEGKNYIERYEVINPYNQQQQQQQLGMPDFLYLDSDYQSLILGKKTSGATLKLFKMTIDALSSVNSLDQEEKADI